MRTALSITAAGAGRPPNLRDIGGLLTEAFVEQREWRLVLLDFWRRAVRDDDVREWFIAHRRDIRDVMAHCVQQIVGEGPAVSGFTKGEVVIVVRALSNGLAIKQYVDPNSISDDLFGRVLVQLSQSR